MQAAFAEQPALVSQPRAAASFKPLRLVTVEMDKSFGQLKVQYHEVLRQDMLLVLVYDHSRPLAMSWCPPVGDNGESKPIAMLVDSEGKNPAMLYLVYPTGLKFMHGTLEYILLTIEKEKPMDPAV